MHEGPDDSGGTVLEQMILGCIKKRSQHESDSSISPTFLVQVSAYVPALTPGSEG